MIQKFWSPTCSGKGFVWCSCKRVVSWRAEKWPVRLRMSHLPSLTREKWRQKKKTCFLKDLLHKGHVTQHVLCSVDSTPPWFHSHFTRKLINLFKREGINGVRIIEGTYMNDETTWVLLVFYLGSISKYWTFFVNSLTQCCEEISEVGTLKDLIC